MELKEKWLSVLDKKISLLKKHFNENKISQSLLFIGAEGSGRHILAEEFSHIVNKDILDITENLSYDYLLQTYISPTQYVYLVDISNISIKEQNVLLKFIEEPPTNSYVVLLAQTYDQILPTIINRCTQYSIGPFNKEKLRLFTDNETLLQYFYTPGQILKYESLDINSIVDLAEKIFLKLSQANYSNVLSISNKIGWKSEENLFDKDAFLQILREIAYNKYIDGKVNWKIVDLTHQFSASLLIPRVDKKLLFEGYLVRLKELLDANQ